MQLYCDFDGTISQDDATDFILNRLADPEWRSIEQEWRSGKIGSAECMARQIALIKANRATLDATLDQIAIDPYFVEFIAYCQMNAITVTIVSDGVDYFIRRILSRVGLNHLPIIANRLVIGDTGGFELLSPYARTDCSSASGVCKCRVVDDGQEPRIYIGDGRSDFCVSNKPEIVFAQKSLAIYCTQNSIPFIGYKDFSDVLCALERIMPVTIPHANHYLNA